MKFKHRIKLKKISDYVIDKIKELSRTPFYVYIYKQILHSFTYNHKTCVRYYEYVGRPHDESILLDLYDYHAKYGIIGNTDDLPKMYEFVEDYMEDKFNKYRDIYFVKGEDDQGRYFEIGYLEDY